MLRILIAAIILLAAVYFYLNSGGSKEQVIEEQQQAIEKAREVEQTVQDQADKLQEKIDEATDDDG